MRRSTRIPTASPTCSPARARSVGGSMPGSPTRRPRRGATCPPSIYDRGPARSFASRSTGTLSPATRNTPALLARQPGALVLERVDERGLPPLAGGQAPVERAGVAEPASAQLRDLVLAAGVERRQPAAPADRLGMVGVPGPAVGQDRPDRVQLAVLTEQVPVAERADVDVPDPQSRY